MQLKTAHNSPTKASESATKRTNKNIQAQNNKTPSKAKVKRAMSVAAKVVQKYDKHANDYDLHGYVFKARSTIRKAIDCFLDCVVFNDFRDPRKILYPMKTLIMCITLGWLCGYRCALHLEQFVRENRGFLMKIILGYKGEFISHDTFNRFLSKCVFEDFNGFLSAFSKAIFVTIQHSRFRGQDLPLSIKNGSHEHSVSHSQPPRTG